MELDWTTFILEIVNFVILVLLLKHFLYRPVLAFVAKRQAGIEQTLAEANRTRDEATALKAQYENRLADWARERKLAFDQLQHEMEQERSRQMAASRKALNEEREKARVVDERQRQEFTRQAEQAALALGGRFASHLLARTADDATTTALARLLAEELPSLPSEQRDALRQIAAGGQREVQVLSAHPLDETSRRELGSAFSGLLGEAPNYVFAVDPALIAGVRLSFGPWLLGVNLQDELGALAALAHEHG